MITGFDLQAYANILAALTNINHLFASEVPEGKFQGFDTLEVQGYTCIRLANRYLNRRSPADNSSHDSASLEIIDPHNILKKAAGNKFVHGEDNVVKYYRKRLFPDGKGGM